MSTDKRVSMNMSTTCVVIPRYHRSSVSELFYNKHDRLEFEEKQYHERKYSFRRLSEELVEKNRECVVLLEQLRNMKHTYAVNAGSDMRTRRTVWQVCKRVQHKLGRKMQAYNFLKRECYSLAKNLRELKQAYKETDELLMETPPSREYQALIRDLRPMERALLEQNDAE